MRIYAPLLVLAALGGCASDNLPKLPPAPPPPQGVNLEKADTQSLLRVGDRLLAAGDLRAAIGIYQRALTQSPDNIEALIKLGDVYWLSGALGQASSIYDRALTIAPDDPAAMSRRARSHIISNEPETALDLMDRLIESGNSEAVAYATRGLALDLLGRPEEAQADYAEALDRDPDNVALRTNAALSFALSENYEASIELLRGLVNRPDARARAREALALVYALSGQTDIAVDLTKDVEGGGEDRRFFYSQLQFLTPQDQAVAVYLRRLPPGLYRPPEEQRRASAAPPAASEAEPMPPTVTEPAAVAEPEPEFEPEPEASEGPVAAMTREVEAPAPAEDVAGELAFWPQIASFRREEAVGLAWLQMLDRHGESLTNVRPFKQSLQDDAGDPVYRLMAGRFETRGAAIEVCERLRAVEIDCVVVVNDLGGQPLIDSE